MTAALKLKDPYTLEEKPRQHIKKQRHYLGNKGSYSQSCGLTSSDATDATVGPQRRLIIEELKPLNCDVGETS